MLEINLRLIREEDANALYHLIDQNRGELMPYFPVSVAKATDLESTKDYIKEKMWQAEEGILYCWAIETLSTKTLIGCCIIKNIDLRVPKCELAYYLDKQYKGQGIISNAVEKVLGYCFTKLKMEKVFLRIDPQNIGSWQVAIKNGFEQEGYLHNEFRTGKGELIDVLYFAKLK